MAKEKLTNEEIVGFCQQMVMVLKAGINPIEGLMMIQDDHYHHAIHQSFLKIIDDIEMGQSLGQALKDSQLFPEYFSSMLAFGEMAGRLEDVLQSLGDYYQRQEELKQSIKSVLTYPFIMMAVMLVVVGVLIIQVLPIFNQVYQQLGTTITGLSLVMMNLGTWISNHALYLVALIFSVIVLCFVLVKTKQGQQWIKTMVMTLPITKTIFKNIALSRFTGSLSIALKSGLDIPESLRACQNVVGHRQVALQIEKCLVMVEDHIDLSEAVEKQGLLQGIYQRMYTMAVKTGNSDDVLEDISQHYLQAAEKQIDHLVSIIEPTIVIVLAMIVGVILLSVMLPLIEIMANL